MTTATHTPAITHAEVTAFAEDRVNLHRDDVREHREQVGRLRQHLADHIAEHPEFSLVKMLLSGSLAKGTALSTLNDIDVAVYMKAGDAPTDETDMLPWITDLLREAYSGVMEPDQFQPQNHSVRVSFRGSGLDVEAVPVYYEGDAEDRGYVVAQDTGERVLTSIPLHLEFIRKRKAQQPAHFAQIVRLIKWWARFEKGNRPGFRFKSFLAELLLAYLADQGLDMSNYPLALEEFFAFIVKTGIQERIAFTDYYRTSALPQSTLAPIEVFDPVNPNNNITSGYSETERRLIVDASHDALDSLNEAHWSDTKWRALESWRRVLGPAFGV